RSLPGESIARVEAPQPAVAVDPRDAVVDLDDGPFGRLARTDREPVAAGVVDERDAQGGGDAGGQVAGIALPERVPPQVTGPLEQAVDAPHRGQRDRGDVFAGLEVRGVRACAGMDDRMVSLEPDVRIVPASPQIVARVVVRGAAEPDRPRAVGGVL